MTVTTKNEKKTIFFSPHDPERNVITVYVASLTHLTVTFLPFASVLRETTKDPFGV